MSFLQSRIFEIPRKWSNRELRRFAHFFDGSVVNVSAWQDKDKEGDFYKNYFKNASSYSITNFSAEAMGFQGLKDEIFLNLEKPLLKSLANKFDVVFNHTTLEHIYEFRKAFQNLCLMTKDIVILVVPFLQQMHSPYGDYWRFTPLALRRLFEENGMKVIYSSFNQDSHSSIYLFFIASKKSKKWKNKIYNKFSYNAKKNLLNSSESYIGVRSIQDNIFVAFLRYLKLFLVKVAGGQGK